MVQCECLTKAGTQCNRKATIGRFCGLHQDCKTPIESKPTPPKKGAKAPAKRKSSVKRADPQSRKQKGIKILPEKVKSPAKSKAVEEKVKSPTKPTAQIEPVSKPPPKVSKYATDLNINIGNFEITLSALKGGIYAVPLRISWPSFGGVSLEKAQEFYNDLGYAIKLAEEYKHQGY